MLHISPIHAFSDNFIWLIQGTDPHRGVVVDPGDAQPVLRHLRNGNIQLDAILITHKHSDHVGGIRELLRHYPGISVFGPAGEPIPGITHRLHEGDRITLEALEAQFSVLEVPGHTEGHIAYFYAEDGHHALFCGDTIFSVGCGRVFSGTFEQLHDSLMRIANLPDDTELYCAHEYTLDNIGFAKWVEPQNPALLAREEQADALLDADHDTVPSNLKMEKATNPFLRIQDPAVIAAVEGHAGRRMHSTQDTFRTLRQWKDQEYD